jgi:hypothetical protein
LVIQGAPAVLVRLESCAETINDFRGLVAAVLQDAPQPMLPEEIIVLVPRLSHPVRVKKKGVARVE